jgi:hypothetical protein
MRIRMLRRPRETCIDGVRLDHYQPGMQYELGSSLAALFVAEGWGEPLLFDESPRTPPALKRTSAHQASNLMCEKYPPYVDSLDVAQDSSRRKRRTAKPPKR